MMSSLACMMSHSESSLACKDLIAFFNFTTHILSFILFDSEELLGVTIVLARRTDGQLSVSYYVVVNLSSVCEWNAQSHRHHLVNTPDMHIRICHAPRRYHVRRSSLHAPRAAGWSAPSSPPPPRCELPYEEIEQHWLQVRVLDGCGWGG